MVALVKAIHPSYSEQEVGIGVATAHSSPYRFYPFKFEAKF